MMCYRWLILFLNCRLNIKTWCAKAFRLYRYVDSASAWRAGYDIIILALNQLQVIHRAVTESLTNYDIDT